MQNNKTPLDEVTRVQDLEALNAEEQLEEQNLARLTETADVSMKRIPIFALVLTAVLFGYYLSSFTSFFPLTGEAENWGELRGQFGALGDFFGGLLNPVLSFCTIVLLIFSLRVQMGELSLSRKELKRTRLAHEQQLEDARQAAKATRDFYNEQLNYLKEQNEALREQTKLTVKEAARQTQEIKDQQAMRYQTNLIELIDRQSAKIEELFNNKIFKGLEHNQLIEYKRLSQSINNTAIKLEMAVCHKFELLLLLKALTVDITVFDFHLREALQEFIEIFNRGFFRGKNSSEPIEVLFENIRTRGHLNLDNYPKDKYMVALEELQNKVRNHNLTTNYADKIYEISWFELDELMI